MALGTSLFTVTEVLCDTANDLLGRRLNNRVTASPDKVLDLEVGVAGAVGIEAGVRDFVVGAGEVGGDGHGHHVVLELDSERLKVLRAVLLDGDGVVTLSEDSLDGDKIGGDTIGIDGGPEVGLDAVRLGGVDLEVGVVTVAVLTTIVLELALALGLSVAGAELARVRGGVEAVDVGLHDVDGGTLGSGVAWLGVP